MAGLDEDLLLCPMRALCIYLDRLVLSLSFAIAFLSLFVAPFAPCQRMWYPSFCARSFTRPGRLDLRWVQFEPMRFAVSPPLSPSTGTGQSPRSWSPPLGAKFGVFLFFTCATFSMNTMAFARWVRSWLRVRGSSSPHLFLTCSGGGGGATSPLSPLLRGSCTCLSFWLCGLPIQLLCRFWSTPLFLFCFSFYVFYFTFFVSYIYLFGVVLYGHMT